MPSKTRRGRGRAIRPGAAGATQFPSAQFVKDQLTPARRQAGLKALLEQLGYPTDDADEAALASYLTGTPGPVVCGVRRLVRAKSLGKNIRVWVVEVDQIRKVTDANALIAKVRNFATQFTYLLIVTDYQRYLWVQQRGPSIHKLWLDPSQVYHSDLHTLALLRLSGPEADWIEYLRVWNEAFSVERVTNDFFRDYIEAQKELQNAIRQRGMPEEEQFEYAQHLMGRLMFLYFLQRKGWLGREGRGSSGGGKLEADPNYLQRRFSEVVAKSEGEAFYQKFLKPLFFEVLCVPRRERPASITRQFGEIPFLNGGLFHKSEIEKKHPGIAIADTAFAGVLDPETGLFRRYHFTVREDQPLDRQVAVDPEMLGKIFEQQVVGRDVKGAFYTPAPVVDYMCRESLKAYVLAHAGGEGETAIWDGDSPIAREAILDLFEMTPTEEADKKTSRVHRLSDDDAGRLDHLLDEVSIIDPAVGSGAFPVGMLHLLVDLRYALIRRSNDVTRVRVPLLRKSLPATLRNKLKDVAPEESWLRYALKRRVIQHNLFGVDIERYAIQIAQLRLWLSLAVEHEVEFVDDVQPLPNLDFNFVVGNTLVGTFRPPRSKEAFDLELQLARPQPGSPIARVAAEIEERTCRFADIEHEEEKDGERAEIANLHRSLLREQIEQTLKEIPQKIEEIRKQFLFADFGDPTQQGRIDYLEHQQEVLPRVLETLQNGHDIDGSAMPMLWSLRFPHIFADRGGFDICIANPPYVSTQGANKLDYIEDLKKKVGFNDDFYVFFSYRALGHPQSERLAPITRTGGVVCFITSDTYFTLSSKTHFRELLQSKRLLKIGQLDPFKATVDAAIFIAQNRPRIDSEPAEFFQARFVQTYDELSEMSDRLLSDKDRWQPEAIFVVNSVKAESGNRDDEEASKTTEFESARDGTCGGFNSDTQHREGVFRYQVNPVVWRTTLKHVFFEPSNRNAALHNRFMHSLVQLVDQWWDKIEDSRKFVDNLPKTREYYQTLKPGDVTMVGLFCEGGQGMRTANNGRFLGYLEGTSQANRIEQREAELRERWANHSDTARTFQRLVRKHRNFPELADAMKEEFRDWTETLGFLRGEIYRIVRKEEVADVESLSEEERKQGIKAHKFWVPFRKGDPEGNRWVSFDPLYICWSRENVSWLSDRSNPLPRWQGYRFFFTEGITWTAVANHVALKARIQPKCVFDADSMRLTPVSETISPHAFLSILNSDLFSYIKWRFLKNTQKYEIGDLRLVPLVWPTKAQERTLAELAQKAIELQTRVLKNGDKEAEISLGHLETALNDLVETVYGVAGLGPFNEF